MGKKIAKFVCSAFTPEQFPNLVDLRGQPMKEVALVGRSNVGKSSLINHLFDDRSLAKTSSTPGKTQSINFFTIEEGTAFVDLPGYGYAKTSKKVRQEWAYMIDHYLEKRLQLSLVLILLDSRHPPTEQDCAMIQWATFNKKPLLIVFTKADKLSDREKREITLSSLGKLQNFLHSSPVQFLHYSIKLPNARMELFEKINRLLSTHGTHP